MGDLRPPTAADKRALVARPNTEPRLSCALDSSSRLQDGALGLLLRLFVGLPRTSAQTQDSLGGGACWPRPKSGPRDAKVARGKQ